MRSWLSRLHAAIRRPGVTLTVSGVLLLTSSVEIWEGLDELLIGEGAVGVHHGVAVYALYQFLKALPELFESAKLLEESVEENPHATSSPPSSAHFSEAPPSA